MNATQPANRMQYEGQPCVSPAERAAIDRAKAQATLEMWISGTPGFYLRLQQILEEQTRE